MVEFSRRRRRSSAVELTPLIDVVFQLLVFFLLTSAAMTRTIPLNLPKVESAVEDSREDVVSISVDRDGHVYLDAVQVGVGELRKRLRAARQATTDLTAVVAADGRAAHVHFVRVLDILRQEGITKLGIEVDDRVGPLEEP